MTKLAVIVMSVISICVPIAVDQDFTGRARNPRTIKEEEPFECIRCGTPFATKSMIEAVMQRMSTHAMFADDTALNRLQMCADCRVIDMAEAVPDPMAAGQRPVPRTTDDYLRAGAYELVVAGEKVPARLHLGPLYDPAMKRIKC